MPDERAEKNIDQNNATPNKNIVEEVEQMGEQIAKAQEDKDFEEKRAAGYRYEIEHFDELAKQQELDYLTVRADYAREAANAIDVDSEGKRQFLEAENRKPLIQAVIDEVDPVVTAMRSEINNPKREVTTSRTSYDPFKRLWMKTKNPTAQNKIYEWIVAPEESGCKYTMQLVAAKEPSLVSRLKRRIQQG